MQYNSQIIGQN
jgi:hypothetical protein